MVSYTRGLAGAVVACYVLAAQGPHPLLAATPVPAEITSPSSNPVISVKQTATTRVAVLSHEGPYWSVGPLVEQVRAAADELQESGPCFIEFAEAQPTGPARMKVGVVLEGMKEPQPPLVAERWLEAKVAYLLASGSYGTTARYHAELRRWANENGYLPAGPITEIYWPARSGSEVVEIRLVIQPQTNDARRPELPGVAFVVANESADSSADLDDSTSHGLFVGRSGSIGESAFSDSPAANEDPTPGQTSAPPPVEELFYAEQYDRIAWHLLRGWSHMPEETRDWLGSLISRLSALERAIDSRGASESAGGLMRLIPTVRDQYNALSGAAQGGSSVIVRAAANDVKAGVLLKLDRMLGRLAAGSTTSDQAVAECLGVISEATLAVEKDAAQAGRPR